MKKKNRFIDYLLNIFSIFAILLFAISFSAFIPCFFKGFYTPWINWLDIPNASGYSYDAVKYAYSNLLDYIWRGAPFNPGMPMSESGIAHFADCIPLFWMQLWFLLGSLVYLVIFYLLCKLKKINKIYLWKLPLYSYGGIILLIFLIALGIFALIDFNSLFTLFHKVFFPGKDNWVFDPNLDQVIRILPEEYFLVCAVFIISLSVIISILFIVSGYLECKRNKEKEFVYKNFNTVLLLKSINEIDDKYFSKLSKKDKEKVSNLKNDNDKKLSLLARSLEKSYLSNHKIYYLDNKKPYLKSVIQYNLSHKDKYVLFGLSSSNIGVDIEKKKELDESFINFSFSKDEIVNMKVFDISPIKMWTIKEALLKCIGKGIINKLNKEVVIIKNKDTLIYNNKEYYFRSFEVDDYVLSIVLEEDKLPNKISYE